MHLPSVAGAAGFGASHFAMNGFTNPCFDSMSDCNILECYPETVTSTKLKFQLQNHGGRILIDDSDPPSRASGPLPEHRLTEGERNRCKRHKKASLQESQPSGVVLQILTSD